MSPSSRTRRTSCRGDTNETYDVFVRDRLTHSTQRVSVSSDGTQANNGSLGAAMSPDGRYVAFPSLASNLVPGDTNETIDVFLRDRVEHTTERVSVSSTGAQQNGSLVSVPALSADGRYVAFTSDASNLAPKDTNGVEDVFVRDRQTGTTGRVSLSNLGAAQGNGYSFAPAISADGRYVTFGSVATNLVSGDTNNEADIFVRDRQKHTTRRINLSSIGKAQATAMSVEPVISRDGRYIAYSSVAPNLVPGDTNQREDVFVRDRLTHTTSRVSVSSTGAQIGGGSGGPSLSANGRRIAFVSSGANAVRGDTNGRTDVFVRDLGANTTERVSISSTGAQGNNDSRACAISRDGQHVAYSSDASNLVPGDVNGNLDVFLAIGFD